jgi:hypothetical protein
VESVGLAVLGEKHFKANEALSISPCKSTMNYG